MLRTDDDRFSRMRSIECIDPDLIEGCRCLVIGAGALGNETIKDLVLSGFRDITVVDDDIVSRSNLSRCLFFRECDVKRTKKVKAIMKRARELDPDVRLSCRCSKVQNIKMNGFDLVLGCVDNIEARLHINAYSRHLSIPYVDGGTHGLRGRVQVVLPEGPCLQCSMNRTHVREMERHFSCSGEGRYVSPVPSDITTTAVIAAIMVREGMKIASGMEGVCMKDVCFYDGRRGTMETLEVSIDKDCPNHGG